MNDLLLSSETILDSLSEGVYVCDRDRRIVFWSKSAERITGWQSDDVVGNAAWKKFFVMEDIPQEIQYKAQTVQLQDDITIIEVRYADQNASG